MAEDLKEKLLDAALAHVPFDGWSAATFDASVADLGADRGLARAACPRGAKDLAVAFHQRGDAEMAARLATTDLAALKFRERIALAVRFRLEAVADREVVRRGSAFFALPQHAADGARLIWGTAGLIWETLGDTSDDINWYTKRATLSAVYGSTVLYWLGDDSPGHAATWAFLDRRIEDVMQFEKLKARAAEAPGLKALLAGPAWLAGKVRAPSRGPEMPLPGRRSRRG
jgi:ubiquinone biosynthesis protein COQ9